MLLFVSVKLTLCVMLIGPVVLVPLVLYGRRVRRLSSRAQAQYAEAVAFAGETLDLVDTVQAFGREKSVGDRFAASPFRERFEAKGRFRSYLAAIPTLVITCELPAFLGCFAALSG